MPGFCPEGGGGGVGMLKFRFDMPIMKHFSKKRVCAFSISSWLKNSAYIQFLKQWNERQNAKYLHTNNKNNTQALAP